MRRLCATVLIFEAIVIGLGITVAVHIDHLTASSAGLTGGIGAGAAVVLAALARPALRVTLVGGSLLQLFVIAAGSVVPVLYILGGVFAALWAIGIWLGYHAEHAAGH